MAHMYAVIHATVQQKSDLTGSVSNKFPRAVSPTKAQAVTFFYVPLLLTLLAKDDAMLYPHAQPISSAEVCKALLSSMKK